MKYVQIFDSPPQINSFMLISLEVPTINVCYWLVLKLYFKKALLYPASSADSYKIHKALHYHTSNVTVWQLILLKG